MMAIMDAESRPVVISKSVNYKLRKNECNTFFSRKHFICSLSEPSGFS